MHIMQCIECNPWKAMHNIQFIHLMTSISFHAKWGPHSLPLHAWWGCLSPHRPALSALSLWLQIAIETIAVCKFWQVRIYILLPNNSYRSEFQYCLREEECSRLIFGIVTESEFSILAWWSLDFCCFGRLNLQIKVSPPDFTSLQRTGLKWSITVSKLTRQCF